MQSLTPILPINPGSALLIQENRSQSIKLQAITSIAAGPGVRGQAVGGAGGEADVHTPEGRAETLCRALAHFLQVRAALVHFQKVPGKGKNKQEKPLIRFLCRKVAESS